MQYAVVIEHAPGTNYSAFVPDLPACVSTGDTMEEVRQNIQEAIEFHLDGMRKGGDPIPEPTTQVISPTECEAGFSGPAPNSNCRYTSTKKVKP